MNFDVKILKKDKLFGEYNINILYLYKKKEIKKFKNIDFILPYVS